MAKNKKPQGKRVRRPTLIEVFNAFEHIDRIFSDLSKGEIDTCVATDDAVFKNTDGKWWDIPAALNGWILLWDTLILRYRLSIDLRPLRQVSGDLDAHEYLRVEDVAQAQVVINQCREAYRQMDFDYVASIAGTALLEKERARLIQLRNEKRKHEASVAKGPVTQDASR